SFSRVVIEDKRFRKVGPAGTRIRARDEIGSPIAVQVEKRRVSAGDISVSEPPIWRCPGRIQLIDPDWIGHEVSSDVVIDGPTAVIHSTGIGPGLDDDSVRQAISIHVTQIDGDLSTHGHAPLTTVSKTD